MRQNIGWVVNWYGGKRLRKWASAALSILFLTAVVALTYHALQSAAIVVDMTENRRFSLSGETLDVLSRVSRDIQLTGFYSSRALPQREIDDQFFRLYEMASAEDSGGKIHIDYIDPDREPALAQRFGVNSDSVVFISYLNADGAVDFSSLSRVPRSDSQERDVTGAIARLLAAGTVKVYWETGHGELSAIDPSQQGLSLVNASAQESGLITEPLDLTTASAIPDDASALIFSGPTTDLSAGEIAVLDAYLKRGGALFLMADVLYNSNAFLTQNGPFDDYIGGAFGLRALNAVAVDPSSSGQTALDVIGVVNPSDNGPALNTPALLHLTRALSVQTVNGVDNGQLLVSSAQGYGETNLETLSQTNAFAYDSGQDIAGPITLAAWAWNQQTHARVLLVGDADFATNGFVQSGGNAALFTDGLAWLTDFGTRIRFAPQAYSTSLPLLFVSYQTLSAIGFVTVVVIPGMVLAAGLGISIWRSRR